MSDTPDVREALAKSERDIHVASLRALVEGLTNLPPGAGAAAIRAIDALASPAAQPAEAIGIPPNVEFLAQKIAYKHRSKHAYLPQSVAASLCWEPHDWVIDAMQQYAELAPRFPRAPSELDPNEENPYLLWAEIVRLREAVKGPEGFVSWQDAATHERHLRVTAERRGAVQPEPKPRIEDMTCRDSGIAKCEILTEGGTFCPGGICLRHDPPSPQQVGAPKGEREAFEAHFKHLNHTREKCYGGDGERYAHPHVESIWHGWQARASRKDAAPAAEPWRERFEWLAVQHWVESEAAFRLCLDDTAEDSAAYMAELIAAIDSRTSGKEQSGGERG